MSIPLGVPLNELLWLALAIVVGGALTGDLAMLFGIGGGAIIVPVLYEGVFECSACPTTCACSFVSRQLDRHHPADDGAVPLPARHQRKGLFFPRVTGRGRCRRWSALPAALKLHSRRRRCSRSPSSWSPGFIATKFLFAGDRWNLGEELPGPVPMTLYGFAIGLSSSLMGVSGGSMSTSCSRSTASRSTTRWRRRPGSVCP